MKSKTERIGYIDVAKGIAIILMLMGHFIPFNTILYTIIYSFHMSLFVFVSGYLYKKCGIKEFLCKTIKLYLLYVVIIFISKIYYFCKGNVGLNDIFLSIIMGNSNFINSDISPVDALWFIPFLISIRIIFYCLENLTQKLKRNNNLILFFCIVCLSILGLYLKYKEIYLPWTLDAAFVCIFLYYCGYLIRKFNILDIVFKNNLVVISIFLIYCFLFCFCRIEIALRVYDVFSIVMSLLGSIVVIFISYVIFNYMSRTSSVLQWCGRNSLAILFVHYSLDSFVKVVLFNFVDINILNNFLINLLVIILIVVIFNFFIRLLRRKKV